MKSRERFSDTQSGLAERSRAGAGRGFWLGVSLTSAWGLLCLGALAGCSVFDKSLIPEPTSKPPEELQLAEDCDDVAGLPQAESWNTDVVMDTTNLRGDINCIDNQPDDSPDGFFAVNMKRGDKWHFHVKVPAGSDADPAVYVLDNACRAPGSCLADHNECGPGQGEHFTFVAPDTAEFVVGIDNMTSSGARYTVLAVHAECGKNGKEHPETCDPSDAISSNRERCDELCRRILDADHPTESEPNDEPAVDANVLTLSSDGTLAVKGTLGGNTACDSDSFLLKLDRSSTVEAAVLESQNGEAVGSACPLALHLDLRKSDGTRALAFDDEDSGTCPTLTSDVLAPGEYYIQLTPEDQSRIERFDYVLNVTAAAI